MSSDAHPAPPKPRARRFSVSGGETMRKNSLLGGSGAPPPPLPTERRLSVDRNAIARVMKTEPSGRSRADSSSRPIDHIPPPPVRKGERRLSIDRAAVRKSMEDAAASYSQQGGAVPHGYRRHSVGLGIPFTAPAGHKHGGFANMTNEEAAALASQLHEATQPRRGSAASVSSLKPLEENEEEKHDETDTEKEPAGIGHRATLRRKSIDANVAPPKSISPPPARARDQPGWKEEDDAEERRNAIQKIEESRGYDSEEEGDDMDDEYEKGRRWREMEEDHDPSEFVDLDLDETSKDAVPSAALTEEELHSIKSKRKQVGELNVRLEKERTKKETVLEQRREELEILREGEELEKEKNLLDEQEKRRRMQEQREENIRKIEIRREKKEAAEEIGKLRQRKLERKREENIGKREAELDKEKTHKEIIERRRADKLRQREKEEEEKEMKAEEDAIHKRQMMYTLEARRNAKMKEQEEERARRKLFLSRLQEKREVNIMLFVKEREKRAQVTAEKKKALDGLERRREENIRRKEEDRKHRQEKLQEYMRRREQNISTLEAARDRQKALKMKLINEKMSQVLETEEKRESSIKSREEEREKKRLEREEKRRVLEEIREKNILEKEERRQFRLNLERAQREERVRHFYKERMARLQEEEESLERAAANERLEAQRVEALRVRDSALAKEREITAAHAAEVEAKREKSINERENARGIAAKQKAIALKQLQAKRERNLVAHDMAKAAADAERSRARENLENKRSANIRLRSGGHE
uniref:Uncharacterized protein n=1 Tax=Palpitomonas bilix TaxID=652834 RepID=A0A7S3LRX4_9EUKA|mmetsp:Transcript_4372/g.8834  ORF Transcript_4372/g.8834 Transcript_4372/m.8834 type:complete len:767 (+) Transcript_4372:150-2450(+)